MDNINPDCGNIMQIFNIEFGGIHQSLGLEELKYKRIQCCALSYKSVQLSPLYIYIHFFLSHGSTVPTGPGPPHYQRFTITSHSDTPH
jgi:hypothetical protein